MEREPIVITCEYTAEELRRATMFLQRRRLQRFIVLLTLLALVAWLILIGNGFSAHRLARTFTDSGSWALFRPILPWVGMWVVLFAGLRYLHRRRVRRYFKQTGSTTKRFVYVFRKSGLLLTEPHARHEYDWEAFHDWKELRKMFLVQLSPVTANVIPKRVFKDSAEIDRFRTFLHEHINRPSAKNAFPVIHTATAIPTSDTPGK
jgi:YcxB-like protein